MVDAPPRKAVLPVLTVTLLVVGGLFGNPFFFGGSGAGAGPGSGSGDGGGGYGPTATPAESRAATNDVAAKSVDGSVESVGYTPLFGHTSRPATTPSEGGSGGDAEPSRSLLNTEETVTFLWQGTVLQLRSTGEGTLGMWQRTAEDVSVSPGEFTAATDATVDATTDAADGTAEDGEQVVDDTVNDTTDAVDDAAGGTTDDATDTVDDAVDDTTDTVDDTVDTTEDTVDSTTDSTTDTVDDTTDTVDDTTDTLAGDDSTPTPTATDSDDGGLL